MNLVKIESKSDEQLVEIIKGNLIQVYVGIRNDLPSNPRYLNVEFCGWQVATVLLNNMSIVDLIKIIDTAFKRSRKKPNIFKRLWRWVKK